LHLLFVHISECDEFVTSLLTLRCLGDIIVTESDK
jgi:hypothetical protein